MDDNENQQREEAALHRADSEMRTQTVPNQGVDIETTPFATEQRRPNSHAESFSGQELNIPLEQCDESMDADRTQQVGTQSQSQTSVTKANVPEPVLNVERSEEPDEASTSESAPRKPFSARPSQHSGYVTAEIPEALFQKLQRVGVFLEPSSRPDREQPVIYKLRHKTSTHEHYWKSINLSEEDYETQQIEGAGSVLEMRKDGYLSGPWTPGMPLQLATLVNESMIIHSSHLIDIMSRVVEYYPASKSSGSAIRGGHRQLSISKPYRMLGGAMPKLRDLREDYESSINNRKVTKANNPEEFERRKTTIEHIRILEHELDKVLRMPIEEEERGYRQEPSVASFDMLWLLFKPGTLVYTKIHDELACCMVRTPFWSIFETALEDAVARVTLELHLWFLDFDGINVNRRSHTVKIHSFTGRRNILDLEAYPVTYQKDQTLRNQLTERGKKYMEYLQLLAPQCEYDDYVFTSQGDDKSMRDRHHYKGRVVIDPVLHFRQHGAPFHGTMAWQDKSDIWPSETSGSSRMGKFVDIDPNKRNQELEDTHYMLLPAYVRGFTIGTRKWAWIHVESLRKCHLKPELIDALEIDKESKKMIKAFAPKLRKRERGEERNPKEDLLRIDPIGGKGEGRIVLLHGPPGTGKTFTAECIAEFSARPLLRLSCGELGLDPTKLEERLWKWFRMAEEWQGILLIDEADVYLQQRCLDTSLKRETIVTVFLRAMEYYRGILFLTTNMPNQFDEAVTSRISLVIEFGNLNAEQRGKLREYHVEQIEKDIHQRYILSDDALAALEKMDESTHTYNGREIKNVFQMAIALAAERARESPERVVLQGNDVKQVMNNMEMFEKYQMRARSNRTRAQLARDDGRRHEST